jgi:hypothetical protein
MISAVSHGFEMIIVFWLHPGVFIPKNSKRQDASLRRILPDVKGDSVPDYSAVTG